MVLLEIVMGVDRVSWCAKTRKGSGSWVGTTMHDEGEWGSGKVRSSCWWNECSI